VGCRRNQPGRKAGTWFQFRKTKRSNGRFCHSREDFQKTACLEMRRLRPILWRLRSHRGLPGAPAPGFPPCRCESRLGFFEKRYKPRIGNNRQASHRNAYQWGRVRRHAPQPASACISIPARQWINHCNQADSSSENQCTRLKRTALQTSSPITAVGTNFGCLGTNASNAPTGRARIPARIQDGRHQETEGQDTQGTGPGHSFRWERSVRKKRGTTSSNTQ